MDAQIAEHRPTPRDDLTSFLLEAEIGGEKLSIEHVRGTMTLLMVAGIDTTWSAIGAALWHLAQHPEDRRRLAAEPALMDTAVEEFLRAYAPVTMARLVAKDFDFQGCPLKEGDWLLLPFPAANRDPSVFADPDVVQLDRAENRHAAFGLGPPLPRLQPGPDGAAGGARGVAGPLPGLRAGRSRGRHLVRGPGPRPAHAPGPDPLTRASPRRPCRPGMLVRWRTSVPGPRRRRAGQPACGRPPTSGISRCRPSWSRSSWWRPRTWSAS